MFCYDYDDELCDDNDDIYAYGINIENAIYINCYVMECQKKT